MSIRLGVNIDHIATLRNVRGGIYPSPLIAAKIVKKSGANQITVHTREDMRHITKKDVIDILMYARLSVYNTYEGGSITEGNKYAKSLGSYLKKLSK